MNINYQSDFKILESFIGETDLVTPFRFTYKSSTSASYSISFDGEKYNSCRRLEDGSLLVSLDNHSLMPGELTVTREWFLTDADFEDDICNHTTTESCGITLWKGESDPSTAITEVYPAYQKGDSAYQVALDNGFEGSEEEWLISLRTDLSQERGDSQTLAMSQDASSRIFLAKEDALDLFAYGIERDTTALLSSCKRIGNMSMHSSLPIQSQMRGCLIDNSGNVTEYLDSDDWSDHDRSGASGQVMVEIPEHYRRCETEGTIQRVWLSPTPINGFERIPLSYIGAYEAAVDQQREMLCSVVNSEPNFRGGDNAPSTDNDDELSLLGRPATNFSRSQFRTLARNRGTEGWGIISYEQYRTIYWLFIIEFATLNSQSVFKTDLNDDGFKYGGLGKGLTYIPSANNAWSIYNDRKPFMPCGHTDSLGNESGNIQVQITNPTGVTIPAMSALRYRGIENLFGHTWTLLDGIITVRTNDTTAQTYTTNEPSRLSDTSVEGYTPLQPQTNVGTEAYFSEIIFGDKGEIIPRSCSGGASYEKFCDTANIGSDTSELYTVKYGGAADTNSFAGLTCYNATENGLTASTDTGTRLSFRRE